MARPLKTAPLPDYLEELISLLEAQDRPDHLGAMREVEGRHLGLQIDLAEALDEPPFAERYRRWQQRLELGLADASTGKALAGKGSASNALKDLRALRGDNGRAGSSGGRLVLEKHHGARVAGYRRGW